MEQFKVNRRQFFNSSTVTIGGMALTPYFAGRALATTEEPHFFLMVVAEGGLDNSYHFDARPLAMTAAGELANYLGEEPEVWQGLNGQQTWATRLVAPLKPWRDHFSIINGVVMAPGFDGHEQNMNALVTANPFGGESFLPKLNGTYEVSPTPIDFIELGRRHGDISNGHAGIPMSPAAAVNLQSRINMAPTLTSQSPLGRFVKDRMDQLATGGSGKFSKGAGQMAGAFAKTGYLRELLTELEPPEENEDRLAGNLAVVASFFRRGAARSATLDLEQVQDDQGNTLFVDTHGPEDAAKSDQVVGHYMKQIAQIFSYLAATPYDDTRSLLDVTTILIASEFSRTMRQQGRPIDATGTDHNPLNNTVLIGGKGIKGGQVLGQSDRQSPGESIAKAHRDLDFGDVKIMGKPFDFETGTPRVDQPEKFSASEYITAATVYNTLLHNFGVPKDLFANAERNGGPAKVLTNLIG